MPYINCKACAKKFNAKPSWLKNGWGKYCSRSCRQEAQKTGKTVSCNICGRVAYKSGADLRNSVSKKYFCSKSCQTIWRNSVVHVGSKHPNWTGGNSAYRNMLRRSQQKEICKRCEVNDKRILAVHHIDHNHNNNILSNLTWLCHNCHFLIHHDKNERLKLMAAVV